MEEIVLQLSNDDAAIREQGIAKLIEAYKNADTTADLLQSLPSSTNSKMNDAFNDTMSQVIYSIQASTDVEQSAKILGLILKLCKITPEVIFPHIVILVTTCISISENKLSDVSLRVKALKIIKSLANIKSTTIHNNELLVPIIDMIYSVMQEPVENELGDFYLKTLTNCDTPISCAMQILYVLSERLASKELVAEVLQRAELMFEDPDICVKRSCYLGLAVVVEHCENFIEQDLLKYVRPSFADSRPIMRNIVQFTIARIAEHMEIGGDNEDELISLFFNYLDNCCTKIKQDEDVPTIDTLFDILDQFSLNFGRKMLPHLPRLMDYVFGILESDNSSHMKKLALNSFVLIPDGCLELISTYYPRLIGILKSWVTETQLEEAAELQAPVFDLVSSIGYLFGDENRLPVAEYFTNIGIQVVNTSTDPVLKSAVYKYFATTSGDTPAPIVDALPQIFDSIIESVRIAERGEDVNDEDILRYHESYIDLFDLEDNIASEYQVDGSYFEEKTTAIKTLERFCDELPESFVPFLERSYSEVIKTVNYPKLRIRQASQEAIETFFAISKKIQLTESSRRTMLRSSEILVPFLLEIIYKTTDVDFLDSALETYAKVLKFLRSELLILEKIKDATAKCIIDVLTGNTRSQKLTEEVISSEHLGTIRMLRHYFRSGICSEYLLVVFEQILTIYFPSMDEELSEWESKADNIWYISTCFEGLGPKVSKYASKFVTFFIKVLPDSKYGSSASHAIGEITRYGGSDLYPYYSDIEKALLAVLLQNGDDTREELVEILGSLIEMNYSILSIEEIFPIFVSKLPLRRYFSNYKSVFGGILALMRDRHVVLNGHIKPLTNIAVNILQPDEPNKYEKYEEVSVMATEFLRIVRQDYSHVWEERRTFLTLEEISFVEKFNFAESNDLVEPL